MISFHLVIRSCRPNMILVFAVLAGFLLYLVVLDSLGLDPVRRATNDLIYNAHSQEHNLVNDTGSSEIKFGRPAFGRNYLVIFNVIPKTGSRSVNVAVKRHILHSTEKLDFHIIPDDALSNMSKFEDFIEKIPRPAYISGHAMFPDVEKIHPEVIYINIIRDPVSRVISNYYFDIFGDDMDAAPHAGNTWPVNIEDCLKLTKDPCLDAIKYYQGVTLRQFCGMNERCRNVDRWTLRRAKQNALKYALIGVTSEMDTTMKALEIILPDLLGGVYAEFVQTQNAVRNSTITKNKRKPSAETIQLLREQMKLQYEFYDFIQVYFQDLKRRYRL